MAVAFDGQLYGIGEHLVVVEERILQLDTDGCVFLEGKRLAVGKNSEFAVHFLLSFRVEKPSLVTLPAAI